MGRYNFAAQQVHRHATQLIQLKKQPVPPPWYDVIGQTPPSERLVRPPLQRPQIPTHKPKRNFARKASRTFKPISLNFEEDALRTEFFNDHPWELARPRVILENDGKDGRRWDWGHALAPPAKGEWSGEATTGVLSAWEKRQLTQAGRPLNGEAVVQRQNWLINNVGMTRAAAYDKARKELYRARHYREIEQRVAREEALATGGYFGMSPVEIGGQLEDQQYENWRVWAEKEVAAMKLLQGSSYTGVGADESTESEASLEEPELEEVSESIPASKQGQTAKGGAPFRI